MTPPVRVPKTATIGQVLAWQMGVDCVLPCGRRMVSEGSAKGKLSYLKEGRGCHRYSSTALPTTHLGCCCAAQREIRLMVISQPRWLSPGTHLASGPSSDSDCPPCAVESHVEAESPASCMRQL